MSNCPLPVHLTGAGSHVNVCSAHSPVLDSSGAPAARAFPGGSESGQSRDKVQRAKPFQTQISRYVRQELQADLVAALTVAMVAIPQGMSYAAIAGVNPIHGLYTAIVPAIVGALLGSSSHLITGPTNATALATAGVLLGFAGRPDYVELVFAVAVITGLVRLLLGLLQLGGIIRYVSSSVLTGFLAGAGVLIILNQLHTALGLARPVGASAGALLLDLLGRLHKLNPYVAATTCLSAAVLITGPRIQRRLPRALLAIFLAALWVQAAGWEARGVLLVKDLRSVTRAQFGFHVPDLPVRLWGELLASSGAVALLSLVEAMSIANIIALASNERIKPSREFVGQGVASPVSYTHLRAHET